MNYTKLSKIDDKLHDRIISVAYGNASFLEKYRINKLALKDENVKQILDEYSNIAKAVHSIQKEEFAGKPKIKSILDEQKSFIDDFYLILVGKPAISFIAGLLLVFAITFSLINNQELSYEGYSVAEVKQASIETKQALLIVSEIFSKTEDKIKYEILTEEVSKPINKGMNTVNKLFKKEKENES